MLIMFMCPLRGRLFSITVLLLTTFTKLTLIMAVIMIMLVMTFTELTLIMAVIMLVTTFTELVHICYNDASIVGNTTNKGVVTYTNYVVYISVSHVYRPYLFFFFFFFVFYTVHVPTQMFTDTSSPSV